jgi:HAD superfamily hydrolase (TIGR01490 family)
VSAIAFFDLDKTLISINSARAWISRERAGGRVGRYDALRSVWWFGMYHLGRADMDEVVRSAVRTLAGQSVAGFTERTGQFWEEEVLGTVRPGAVPAVERHRRRGDRLVVLTASSRQLADLAAAHLGFDDVLANEFEESDGRFTGRAREPLCYGDGKVHHAQSYAARHGVALEDCTFYSDSFTDRLALEAVGTPVCVSPDPRLQRLAVARGWRIEDWGKAGV